MKTAVILVFLALTGSVFGCQHNPSEPQSVAETAPDAQQKGQKMQQNNMISLSGKIEYKDFEGGFYAFIADDGRQFTPQGLAPEYRRDGLSLTLTGTPMPNIMTTTQFGVVFKVASVSAVDDSNVDTKAPVPTNPSEI